MDKKIAPRLMLLLGLSLVMTGLVGCKGSPDKDASVTSDNTAPGSAAAPTPPGTASPETSAATPGAAGETAVPGQPGAPGQPGLPGQAGEAPLPTEKIPEVVADVNGVKIHKRDLLQASQVVEMRFAQMGRRVTPTPAFYRQVLNELVAITLLQQDAKAQGVKATDQEIQQALAARKSQFPSEDAYKQALAKAGVSETALRQQAGDQIAVQKYVQNRIAPKVAVSDQAAKEFYDKNKAEMQVPERVHARHILIRTQPGATPAEKEAARKKAEDLLKRIQGGEDFGTLAMANSDDGSKARGGDLGFFMRGQMVPPFDKAAFALTKPNELSPVVETEFGYHIIQLVERAPAGTVPFEQVKERIVLGLKQQQAQRLVQARADELRKQGKVQIFI